MPETTTAGDPGRTAKENGLLQLVTYLLQRHSFLRKEMDEVRAALEECAEIEGRHGSVAGVARFFGGLARDLAAHFDKEELELFPRVVALHEGRGADSLDRVIRELETEHEEAGDALTHTHVSLAAELLPRTTPELEKARSRLDSIVAELRDHVEQENLLFLKARKAMNRADR